MSPIFRCWPLASALLVIGATACRDWRDRVVPGLAVEAPHQASLDGAPPIALSRRGVSARLTPRARYSTRAWVVAVDDKFDDGAEAVMSLDTALAWGPLGRPELLKTMDFHLARRYVSVRWSGEVRIDARAVMQHLSNHHLIPATDALVSYLEHVVPGDLLALEGLLVDVELGGVHRRTSLSREDIGNGACEILYVERAEITRPPRP